MTNAVDLAEAHRELLASVCRDSFERFVREFWATMTNVPLAPNHATTAVIAALQAVADGKIWRLLIALPPGSGKSTLLALYAAWRFARDPAWRSLHAMHATRLAETESRRVRRLVLGDKFRSLFPYVDLRDDENRIDDWATTRGGRYAAVGLDGAITGRRVLELVLDDPLNAQDAKFSKTAREHAHTSLTGALMSRLDGDRAPIIVVHQRLDRDDLIGRLATSPETWTMLELAAEFDPARRCSIPGVWTDPRTEEGELLAPTVISREKLEELKQPGAMGLAEVNTQFNQRPSDDTNAVWKRAWWRFYAPPGVPLDAPRPPGCDMDTPTVLMPEHFEHIVIGADYSAGSVKTTGDLNAVQVWGGSRGGRYLLDQWWARAGFEDALARSLEMARRYPRAKFVIEHAANGRPLVEKLTKELAGIFPVPARGSKASRWSAVAPTVESRSCYLPLGLPKLSALIEEFAGASKHDDALDAAALCLHELAGMPSWTPSMTIVGGYTIIPGAETGGDRETDRARVVPLGYLISSPRSGSPWS